MFYSVDGKIVQVGNAFPERKVNSLTFQTRDSAFPVNTISTGCEIRFDTNVDQFITVYYGDGTQASVKQSNGEVGLANGTLENRAGYLNQHVFTDTENNGTLRNIVVEFENIEEITFIFFNNARLYGMLPEDLGAVKKLNSVTLQRTYQIESIPNNLANLENLVSISFNSSFKTGFNPTKLPDWLFNTPLSSIGGTNSFNLSDPFESNLFKINQLAGSLSILQLAGCNISKLNSEFSELSNLYVLVLSPVENPEVIENLTELLILTIGVPEGSNYIINCNNFKKLSRLSYTMSGEQDFSDIVTKWVGLKSVTIVNTFNLLSGIDSNFDNFINNFYLLTTQNAYLDPSNAPVDEEYPNQFRDVSWGGGNSTQIGQIQAPSGFIQGIDNGTPANQGEKIYVLVNNYGHNVTTSGNFN